jgi:hypothetical protein
MNRLEFITHLFNLEADQNAAGVNGFRVEHQRLKNNQVLAL